MCRSGLGWAGLEGDQASGLRMPLSVRAASLTPTTASCVRKAPASTGSPCGNECSWQDVLTCPCGGRRPIVSDVQERSAVIALLAPLGLPTEPPPLARARDPAQRAFGFEEAPPRQRARSPARQGAVRAEVRPARLEAGHEGAPGRHEVGRGGPAGPVPGDVTRQIGPCSSYAPVWPKERPSRMLRKPPTAMSFFQRSWTSRRRRARTSLGRRPA
jgi:hypothetical protein